MKQRREITVAVAVCLLGAAVLLIAAGRDWVRIPASGLSRASLAEAVEADLVRALGLAALGGVVGIAAARRWGRLAVGVVLVLVGLGAAALAAQAGANPVPAGDFLGGAPEGTPTAWPWVAVAGGALVVAAGLLVAVRGMRWSALAQRYDGPQAPLADAPAETPVEIWDALSRGEDPTEPAGGQESPR